MAAYLAAICALLIVIFYMFLPPLRVVMPLRSDDRRITRSDALLMAVITALYSLIAFTGLGNTVSPESMRTFDNDSAVIELSEETTGLFSAEIFCGSDVGGYTFEVSRDGQSWSFAGEYTQKYTSVLKWQSVDLSAAFGLPVRFVRVNGTHCSLGEAALKDNEGVVLSASGGALTDEVELVPDKSTFMNSTYFDEIYHVRTAREHMQRVWPYEISHPPLGKLIISIGISLFGLNPFGWRFMGTLFGAMMLPVVYIFCKRLFGGKMIPSCCTVLMASEFMHLVQTRIATIDSYGVFFILLMYLFMFEFVTGGKRLPLALSGIFFGIGCACKWTCIYAGAGLGLIWLIHWMSALISREKHFSDFLKNSLFCVVFFVLIPCCIYYVSYYAYGLARGMSGLGMFFNREYAKLVLDNQSFMLSYHKGVTATHPYSSVWYQWVLDIRPILYYLDHGVDGARVAFASWVNPVLCWGGLLAMFAVIYMAFARGDRTAMFLLIGYLSGLVPWMFVDRVVFEYHYFSCAAFLVLAMGYVFSLFRSGTKNWRGLIIAFTALSALVFWLFLPVLKGTEITAAYSADCLKWLKTWPV